MIKLLQQQAQCYFHNRSNLIQSYNQLKQHPQKVHFFLMLLHSSLSLDHLIAFIAQATVAHATNLTPLLTALWASSLHIDASSQAAKKLFAIVTQIHARNLAPKEQLMSELPQWVIQGSGLADQQTMDKRIARVYTKINYEQSKHSLIRQNNEGYAKLTLLLIGLRDAHDGEAVWRKIVSLIGNFDLDPDRVLDLVVEARMQNSESRHFMQILKHFRKESLVQTIGNMMQAQKTKTLADPTLPEKTVYCGPVDAFDGADLQALFNQIPFMPNPRLSQMAAKSIKAGLFSYGDLRPYLQPSDTVLKRISGKRSELTMAKITKSFTMSMVEIDDNEMIKIFNEENIEFEGQLIYSSKLSLLTQLVKSNNWQDFLSAWAPFKAKFDLVLYQPLLHALLDLLQWSIGTLFDPVSYQRFFNVQTRNSQFQEDGSSKEYAKLSAFDEASIQKLSQLLSYIGRYIAFRPRLFIKLCRILRHNVKEQADHEIFVKRIKQITKNYLVPANGFAQNNGPMSLQLYTLLQCFQYQFRYQCYLLVYRESMTGCPYAARIFQSVKRRQNIIVNNLSKQNKKTFVRKITKLTHNQALPVLYWIARRIVMQDYEAVVPQIVGVLCNSTPMTLDQTIFVMLYVLNEHKQAPVNIKTHEFQPWFKNVITFISSFFRKYLEADIQPVFDYILLKTGLPFSVLEDSDELPGALLKLLHQILNKMHGSVMIEQVNKTKLDAIAAGPKLQAEILQLSSQVRAAKKSKVMLQKFFWEQNRDHHRGRSLAFNLLVLLCQKRGEVFTKAFIDDLRIVADIYDEYTLLIVQIVRVLLYQAQDFNHYALLLPERPLESLLRQYKLPFECACQIVRPGIKHIATMSEEEWKQTVQSFTGAFTLSLQDPKYLLRSSRPNERVETYLNLYKSRVLELLPPAFFTAFWLLTIDSVYFPAKSYTQKLEDVKKKLDQNSTRRNEKESQKLKTLYEKLVKEEEQQRKKYNDTLSEGNLLKLQVETLKGGDKDKQKKQNTLLLFAETFVQICLLPRMMLDRAEALYCVKFTTEMIKANKMPATKIIRLMTYIIEFVMNYLPFTTHREANHCLSVFLAQILAIFMNWSDPIKLKQDMKRILGVEDNAGKDNYPKLRDYLIKLFERVGNIVKSIKEEPYIIKNCLYLLEKVESIPGYKQQAEELMLHMNQLKELYTAVDMRTILDRQVAILTNKKNDLPEKPEQNKKQEKKPLLKVPGEENPRQIGSKAAQPSKSPILVSNNAVKESGSKGAQPSKSPIHGLNNAPNQRIHELAPKTVENVVSASSGHQVPFNRFLPANTQLKRDAHPQQVRNRNSQDHRNKPNQDNRNRANQDNRNRANQDNRNRANQDNRNRANQETWNKNRGNSEAKKITQENKNKISQENRNRTSQEARNKANQEAKNKANQQMVRNKINQENRIRINQQSKNKAAEVSRNAEKKLQQQKARFKAQSSRFSDRPPEKKPQLKEKGEQAKPLQQKQQGAKKDENRSINVVAPVVTGQVNKQVKLTEAKAENANKLGEIGSTVSNIPPPKRLSDVRREQQLKQQGFSSQQSQVGVVQTPQAQLRDSSTKPRQEDLKKETTNDYKNQKPTSSVSADPPKDTLQTETQPKHPITKNSEQNKLLTNQPPLNRQITIDNSREDSKEAPTDNRQKDTSKVPSDSNQEIKADKLQEQKGEKYPQIKGDKYQEARDNKYQEGKGNRYQQGRGGEKGSQSQQIKKDSQWKDKEQGKKWEGGKQKHGYYNREQPQGRQSRKQEKRDKQREKDKDRQRRHEKYRSRSREKYGRR